MYKIKVGALHEFEITSDECLALDAIDVNDNTYHILKNNKSIKATITNLDFNNKSYTVIVNNNSYEVSIMDALDNQIATLGFEIGSSKKANDIKAPMPGLILEINVEEGQEVKENDALVILEAMKMENVINSPRDGVIKSITVNQGETVDKNALLIEFE